MKGGVGRVGERQKALDPKRMRLREDAARSPFAPFAVAGINKSKGQPTTSLSLGIGQKKKSKKND